VPDVYDSSRAPVSGQYRRMTQCKKQHLALSLESASASPSATHRLRNGLKNHQRPSAGFLDHGFRTSENLLLPPGLSPCLRSGIWGSSLESWEPMRARIACTRKQFPHFLSVLPDRAQSKCPSSHGRKFRQGSYSLASWSVGL
jgi:hypothetical protein